MGKQAANGTGVPKKDPFSNRVSLGVFTLRGETDLDIGLFPLCFRLLGDET